MCETEWGRAPSPLHATEIDWPTQAVEFALPNQGG